MQRKRPDVAIRAAIENNASIQLIGTAYPSPGDEKFFQEQLQPLLSEPGVNDLGFIGHPAIYNYYGSARALLFPTEQEEAFGMVMIEAMATGTPVIAYRYSTAPEIIVDGETGFLVPPGDEAAFTAAVNKIIHLPAQEYQEMRKKCRARVEQYYTVQKMVDGFENIYHQLTAHV